MLVLRVLSFVILAIGTYCAGIGWVLAAKQNSDAFGGMVAPMIAVFLALFARMLQAESHRMQGQRSETRAQATSV